MKICIEHVRKIFKGNPKKNIPDTIALNDVNLEINNGELVGLLGPSGCGKSSLLYALSGLKDIDEGHIYFDNEDVTNLKPEKREVGFVFQDYALYPNLSVYENIEFPLIGRKIKTFRFNETVRRNKIILKILLNKETLFETIEKLENKGIGEKEISNEISYIYDVAFSVAKELYEVYRKGHHHPEAYQRLFTNYENDLNKELGKILQNELELGENGIILRDGEPIAETRLLTADEKDVKVREVAKIVGIEKLLDRKPDELSGGEQQRVAIARAIIKEPKLLLLDEPLSNLDTRLRLETREQIRKIQKKTGITTIFVTHDQDEAMSICDRIAIMSKGKIIGCDTPQEIYDDPKTLAIARFIGVPPITVFKGRIEKKTLYIGNQKFFLTKKSMNCDIYLAIRPEAFNIATSKSTHVVELEVASVTRVGKDVIADVSLPDVYDYQKIIYEGKKNLNIGVVKFTVDKEKMFIFSIDGERINIE